jgi:glucose-6-phosphate isomerase
LFCAVKTFKPKRFARCALTSERLSMDAQFLQELSAAAAALPSLNQLFERDSTRVGHWSGQIGAITLDLSKQRIDSDAYARLLAQAKHLQLGAAIQAMFGGAPINSSEKRAVLHGLLRTPASAVAPQLRAQAQTMADALAQMRGICDAMHQGQAQTVGLVQATDVVNIGIGGSDLGPRLVTEALSSYHQPGLRVHFVTNVDAHATQALLSRLDPARTVFIVASKSFGTQETRLNALLARQWIAQYLQAQGLDSARLSQHFLAVSSNVKAAVEFGMQPTHVLPMSDTVGGRYSLWSTVGLSAALAIGFAPFEALMRGARIADADYQNAPLDSNLTVKLALTEVWNRNALGHATRAVVPYDDRLARLPEFLQQLEMESNGKGVGADGSAIAHETAPVVWGGTGTNVQHAFFQAIHQGTQVVPIDFVGVIRPDHAYAENHQTLLANMLGQGAALLRGKSYAQALSESPANLPEAERVALARARVFPGNRPSSTFLFDQLTPEALGTFLALLENKVHAQSVLWRVNAFDQWGVELGKTIANELLPALGDASLADAADASTRALLAVIRRVGG